VIEQIDGPVLAEREIEHIHRLVLSREVGKGRAIKNGTHVLVHSVQSKLFPFQAG